MPMSREDYETLLNELNKPDLDMPRKTEILQLMRTDYTAVIDEHTNNTNTITSLQKDKDDLVVANSKLFRQAGIMDNPELKDKEEKKEFSETVTLESLEANI